MKKGYQSDIACGPWYFGPGGRHNANHAGSVAITSGGKWVTKKSCFQVEDPGVWEKPWGGEYEFFPLHGIVYDGYLPCLRVLKPAEEKGLRALA